MAALSTPSSEFCVVLSPEEKLLLVDAPLDYPCFKGGRFLQAHVSVPACRKRCCVVPPKTPEGEDSPKWLASLDTEAGVDEHRQPVFETPDKTIFKHNVVTGDTPLHMPGWYQEYCRVNRDFPGVPGHSLDNPVYLSTPKRHKRVLF